MLIIADPRAVIAPSEGLTWSGKGDRGSQSRPKKAMRVHQDSSVAG
jgi:hypothetical protein